MTRLLARRVLAAATSLPGRILITAVLLGAVAASIDWRQFGDRVAAGDPGVFALAVLALGAGLVLGGVRWHALLVSASLAVSRGRTARAYAIGLFTNNFLPTGFGGDAARAFLVAPPGRGLTRALVSVLVDRFSALACLVLLAVVAALIAPGDVPHELDVALAGLAVAGFLGSLPLLFALRRGGLGRFLPSRLRRSATEVAAQLRGYLGDRRLLGILLVLGAAAQGFVLLEAWLLASSVHLDVPWALIAVTLPLALVATMLPFSVAGFGVREGAFVVILGTGGVPAADATLLSLLAVLAMTFASLPGGVALALRGERPVRPSPPPSPSAAAVSPARPRDGAIPSGDG